MGLTTVGGDGVVRTGSVVLTNLFTLNEMTPMLFPTPLPIPAGATLDGLFSNDTASQPMNMIVMIVGKLTGADCPK
jgi:hypothetical protein